MEILLDKIILCLWKLFKVLDQAEEIARHAGCEFIVCCALSLYAQKGIDRETGFSVLREIKYEDYVDPLTGKKPDLKLSPIHTKAKLYYKRLLPKESSKL